MNQQRNSYNNYLKQFDGQQAPERVSTSLLYQGQSELISRRGGKVEGSGRYEATYRLPDGRIAELYHSGFLSYIMVWASQEAYNAYQTPMPFAVYHEM
jgi:predicted PolB exonuclease-like 3'-5' exonuclease